MLLNERHGIHDLIQAELRATPAVLFPGIERSSVRLGLAATGVGLDHHAGEQVLVFVDQSLDHKLLPCTVVTDRRVSGSLGFDVRFDLAERIERKGGLVPKILVSMRGGMVETVVGGGYLDALERFFRRLLGAPPGQREPRPRPLCVPSDADPTGARTAGTWLGVADQRTAEWLAFVDIGFATGLVPLEVARDLVARIVLHHRNIHFGRGMASARWLSPLSCSDLSNAMVSVYGNPIGHQETPVRTLDFDTRLRTSTGAAVASSALGLASMALLGVGWIQTARQRTEAMRFLVADTGSCSSFRLQHRDGRELHRGEPGLVYEVDVKLLAREDAILERRIAMGWSAPTPALMEMPAGAIAARFAELLGPSEPEGARPSDGKLRAAVAPVIGDGTVDLEDHDNFIVLHPGGRFEDVRGRYLAHLQKEGWSMIPGSETDGTQVAKMLAEMGQHAAAQLAAEKQSYGASFRRGDLVMALNVDTISREGLRVQLSRIS